MNLSELRKTVDWIVVQTMLRQELPKNIEIVIETGNHEWAFGESSVFLDLDLKRCVVTPSKT
jgi:hypothetical protein